MLVYFQYWRKQHIHAARNFWNVKYIGGIVKKYRVKDVKFYNLEFITIKKHNKIHIFRKYLLKVYLYISMQSDQNTNLFYFNKINDREVKRIMRNKNIFHGVQMCKC